MKYQTIFYRIIITGLILSLAFFDACRTKVDEKPVEKPTEEKTDYTFTGTVTTTEGKAIAGAEITVNGKRERTDKQGKFTIESKKSNRYIVNIRERGFGLVSKIFSGPVREYNYKLRPAFVKKIDPRRANIIRDELSATTCTGNTSFQNLAFDAEYKKIPFVYDQDGNRINFGWTPGMKAIFDQLAGPPVCNPGAQVEIPASTIVDENGVPATDSVTVEITTVDLRSEDGMPGDFTYQNGTTTGAMISMGAVTIELYSGQKRYNLNRKSKEKATLRLPVDPLMLKFYKKIPETIPVLYYDEKDGYWRQENQQVARLNTKTKVYETSLSHFSAINLDLFQPGGQTCYKFRQIVNGDPSLVIKPNFIVYGMTPSIPYATTHVGTESNSCFPKDEADLHVLFNGPFTGNELCVVLANNSGTPNAFFGISIVTAGSTYSGSPGDSNYVDVFACPACDETSPTCLPECQNLPLIRFPASKNVILAAQYAGPGASSTRRAKLRWIFQSPPSATYTYMIESKSSLLDETNWVAIATNSSPGPGQYDGNGTYNTGAPGFNPVTMVEVDLPDPGSDIDVRIQITDGPLGTYPSDPVKIPKVW
jgi:hypothetical protein